MKGYLAYTLVTFRLTLRDKAALFFNYIFPLLFFFIFAQSSRAEQGGVITQVVTMVLILAVLGNGLFGAGVRAVQDRELNILRRFKVTPISPVPILVASMVTGWAVFFPAVLLIIALAHLLYGMPAPAHMISLLALVSLGVIAFRALGLIVASVVNSAQENQILIQILYLPMLFLSGAVIPITLLPGWAQILVQLLPASYLSTGFQGILLRDESLPANWSAIAALILTTILATFLSKKLFRWEKEEKLPASAKLWVVVVLFPFILLGSYQAYTRENVSKARLLYRDVRRSRTMLVRDARIFVGNGKVIGSGAVLIRNGKISRVFEGRSPDPKTLKADVIEGSGKTLLPGLIDAGVRLTSPGGVYKSPVSNDPREMMLREMAAYLYSGVTGVLSGGDPRALLQSIRSRLDRGERLGAELFLPGPILATEGGSGAGPLEVLGGMSGFLTENQGVRPAGTPEKARRQVKHLDEAGVVGIEHGSAREEIPAGTFLVMARRGAAYCPALSVSEAYSQVAAGRASALERSLVLQSAPAELVEGTRKFLQSPNLVAMRAKLAAAYPKSFEVGKQNLRRASAAGVMLVAGSNAGSFLVFHGPAIHRELQLWVEAGIPPADALQAATYNAARLLRAGDRIGLVAEGHDADLLLVDGNPLQDISATERISLVIFKGERVNRPGLFEQE